MRGMGSCDRHPFVYLQGLVDTHANQEHHEIAFDRGGQPFTVNHRPPFEYDQKDNNLP
jgi:hypothetical protein